MIDFKDDEFFVSDPNLDPKHTPGIINLFVAFLYFEDDKHTDWVKDSTEFGVIQPMMVKFSKGPWINQGYHLLRWLVAFHQ